MLEAWVGRFGGRPILARGGAVVGGSLVIAVAAKVAIPLWPVPVTLQTLAVLLIGMGYGAWLGGATVVVYVLEGLAGVPVFAGAHAGPAVIAGPTGGYLVGFVLAAVLVGWLAERGWDRRAGSSAWALLAGHGLIVGLGAAWLGWWFGWGVAWSSGVAPFWVGTVVKTAVGVLVLRAAWRGLGYGALR